MINIHFNAHVLHLPGKMCSFDEFCLFVFFLIISTRPVPIGLVAGSRAVRPRSVAQVATMTSTWSLV